MASGFTGSFYQEIVQRTEFKRLENAQKLMIWARACKKLGGEQQAILALDKGELKAIQHPKDPDKILYCLEEITLTKGKEWTSTERSKLDFFFASTRPTWGFRFMCIYSISLQCLHLRALRRRVHITVTMFFLNRFDNSYPYSSL